VQSTGIITHDTLSGRYEIVGNHESGFIASILTEDELSNVSFVIFHSDVGLMDVRIEVFAFIMRVARRKSEARVAKEFRETTAFYPIPAWKDR
jgi:hypothetical protein